MISSYSSPLEKLPHDNLVYDILTHCSPRDLKAMSGTSKKMYALASSDMLWQKLYPEAQTPSGQSLKNYCCTNLLLNSPEELYNRIENFFKGISENQHANFHCSFQHDADAVLEISISTFREVLFQMGKAHFHGLETIEEKCIYIGNATDTLIFQKGYSDSVSNSHIDKHNCFRFARSAKNVIIGDDVTGKIIEEKFDEIRENNNSKGLMRLAKDAALASQSLFSVLKHKL